MVLSPDISSSKAVTVSGVSAAFSAAMLANEYWLFVSSTACWIKQGAAPTAVASTAGNMYVPANVTVVIKGGLGADVAVIQDSAGGKASLTRIIAY